MLRNKSYIFFLAILLVLYLVVQALKPEPVNWNPSYSKEHTRPYGNYALFRLLNSIFPQQPIVVSRKHPYQELPKYSQGNNYILITSSVHLNDEELDVLDDFIRRGNHVFIAAENFNYEFSQHWGITTKYTPSEIPNYWNEKNRPKTTANFTNPAFKVKKGYELRYDQYNFYFTGLDSGSTQNTENNSISIPSKITVLGTLNNKLPNFISIPHGEGILFLHSNPKLFSNYNIVYHPQNHEYVSKALSYLPIQPVIWDEYFNLGPEGAKTEIRYILSSKSLRWAWFLLLCGIALYMLFESKRRQRIIPVVKPPANKTLEFINTVGRLYYQQKDHTNLAKKKVIFFLERLRKQYYIDTQELDDEFIEVLSARSGIDQEFISSLVKLLRNIQQTHLINEKQLLHLNRQIELFNLKSK
ncbi:MAG: DUF4350 domain-containing protein [Flavobacteriales bacterium]|nr:DUF4350 domain-containing protein [Flavobacteriales bacterium]